MQKIILSFLLIIASCFAFAKNEINPITKETIISKNNTNFSKQLHLLNLSKKHNNKEAIQLLSKKCSLICSLVGTAWAQVEEVECLDGTCSTYVFSGYYWEFSCPEYGIYEVFAIVVESSPTDSGC